MAHKRKKHSKKKQDVSKIHKVKVKKEKPAFDKGLWKIAAIAVAILVIISLTFIFTKRLTSPTGEVCLFNTAKLDFYVMSQCPYGTQVEDAIKPVLDELGSCVNFNLNFISTANADGTFRSLHGEPETQGNIVQLCAAEYNPDKYMDMIVCQNENAGSIPDNWEACAEENGLNVAKIKDCFEGEEGKELLRESILETQAVGASASPTIYLDGAKYSGSRDSLSFKRALCNKIGNHPACNAIPACASDTDCQLTGKIGQCAEGECVFTDPVKIELLVLVDERCKECQTANTMETNKYYFPGIEERYIDYSTEEGKQIYEDYNIQYLPAYIFDGNVVDSYTWKTDSRMPGFFDEINGEYVLKAQTVDATFDPTTEICDNDIDDDEDGMVDCEDTDCSSKMVCREETENNLQVFIMSDCPYGREAVKALYEVVENFGEDITYEAHYIASESGDGFSSLHGQYEVDEDIIQLCVLEHSPGEWLEYIYCRSVNGVKDKDWEVCAADTDVDIDAVQSCFDSGEGADLLREDIKIAKSLNIGASPTWLANNKYTFSGIAAESVKESFCGYNPDLEGCENTLTASTAASGSC